MISLEKIQSYAVFLIVGGITIAYTGVQLLTESISQEEEQPLAEPDTTERVTPEERIVAVEEEVEEQ